MFISGSGPKLSGFIP